MKKLLGISLVAALAVSPMMARADDNPASSFGDQSTEAGLAAGGTNVVTANKGPYYAGKSISATDKASAASAAYVKGAYNDAISAINKVAEIKQDVLTAGDITETLIGAGAVTHAKLGADAVESGNIKDGEVKTADLDNGAVTSAKLGADAVTNDKVADNAIQSENIKDGEVKTDDLDAGAVTFAKVNSGAVVTGGSDTTKNSKLTTQGYVDNAVSGLNIGNYATKTGVKETIKKATASKTGASLDVAGGVTGNIPIMVDWGASTAGDLPLANGAIASNAKATGDITGIAVTVDGYYASSTATAE